MKKPYKSHLYQQFLQTTHSIYPLFHSTALDGKTERTISLNMHIMNMKSFLIAS
jgi:hypothetical protein